MTQTVISLLDEFERALKRWGDLGGSYTEVRSARTALETEFNRLQYDARCPHCGRGRDILHECQPNEPAGNPLPPEILADALQDKIHEDTGAVRAARSVKSRAGDPVEESGPDDPPTRY